MKKLLLFLSICLAGLLIFCFIPKNIENAVVVGKSSNGKMKVYIDGKLSEIRTLNSNLNIPSVVSYKHNLFFNYGFKEISAVEDRILLKSSSQLEFENKGVIKSSSNINYFTIDTSKNIKTTNSGSLIIGEKGVKTYLNSKGEVKTVIIPPENISAIKIRVGISNSNYNSIYHDKITAVSASKLKLFSITDNKSMDIAANTNITFTKNNSEIKAQIDKKTITFKGRIYISGGSIKLTSVSRSSSKFNPVYEGTIELKLMLKGIVVVNELPIEDYLVKVVPSEMPANSALEALKCQAVAARTYCISDMQKNRFSDLGFHVDDSTKSQVYNNAHASDASNAAVKGTSGIIMTYSNSPIDAKYYSTSCGLGAAYSDVWFKADGSSDYRPYLRNVKFDQSIDSAPQSEEAFKSFFESSNSGCIDSASPYYRWNATISTKALSNMLVKTLKGIYTNNRNYLKIQKNGSTIFDFPNVSLLKDIKVVKRSKSGVIISIDYVFDNAEFIVFEDQNIRNSLNFDSKISGEKTILNRYKSEAVENFGHVPSSFFTVVKKGDNYTFYGGGFGHGVGMSQFGAMQLASKGWEYKNILDIYYKDVAFSNINLQK